MSRAIRSLDEHWCRLGHPEGLEGNDIPLLARIVNIAQTVEAFHTRRRWRSCAPRQGRSSTRRWCGRWTRGRQARLSAPPPVVVPPSVAPTLAPLSSSSHTTSPARCTGLPYSSCSSATGCLASGTPDVALSDGCTRIPAITAGPATTVALKVVRSAVPGTVATSDTVRVLPAIVQNS
ncbi:MAG: hypothetical protein ACYC3Q_15985 [Gemmatimonadaceae bacterium]